MEIITDQEYSLNEWLCLDNANAKLDTSSDFFKDAIDIKCSF